jgi:hypothetical protein
MMAMGFLANWPPGPVVSFVINEDDGGGERKALDVAGQRHARETGVEAIGVDACDCESWEVVRGRPLLALRTRREDETQSPLSRLRLGRPQIREGSTATPVLLERGM